MISVLHIIAYDTGGAAVAATRLSKSLSLISRQIYSSIYSSRTTDKFPTNYIYRRLVLAFRLIIDRLLLKNFSITPIDFGVFFSFRLFFIRLSSRSTIYHLHWTNAEFFSLWDILLIRSSPIVWTLHDTWPLYGIFHYEPIPKSPSDILSQPFRLKCFRYIDSFFRSFKTHLLSKAHIHFIAIQVDLS